MSAVSLTAANISPLVEHGAVVLPYTAAGAITVGQAVYLASGGIAVADGDASKASSRAIGIAVASFDGETSIASGAPVSVCVYGPVAGFSGMTAGATLWVSDTAGSIDTSNGTYKVVLGYAMNATTIFVAPSMADPSSA